jgi:hypothetical protein
MLIRQGDRERMAFIACRAVEGDRNLTAGSSARRAKEARRCDRSRRYVCAMRSEQGAIVCESRAIWRFVVPFASCAGRFANFAVRRGVHGWRVCLRVLPFPAWPRAGWRPRSRRIRCGVISSTRRRHAAAPDAGLHAHAELRRDPAETMVRRSCAHSAAVHGGVCAGTTTPGPERELGQRAATVPGYIPSLDCTSCITDANGDGCPANASIMARPGRRAGYRVDGRTF